ncbi:MAG: BrnT family toxin [Gammaproteobacteria bacterium]|nr:BrnT family toxin [Gammaproteobacteria bacterium]
MKPINWNPEKNRKLIEERDISFEDIVFSLQSGCLLDDIAHPNNKKYPHQRVFVVAIDEYAYLVPYIENDEEIFLKTVMPSRKATKHYFGEK